MTELEKELAKIRPICLRNGHKPTIPYCIWFFCNGDPILCGVRAGDRIYPKVRSTRIDLKELGFEVQDV